MQTQYLLSYKEAYQHFQIEVIINLAEYNAKFALEINRLIEDRDKAIKLVQGIGSS